MFAHDKLLRCAQLQRIGCGQLAGKIRSHALSRLPARGEDQHRSEVLGQRLCHQAGPVTSNLGRNVVVEVVRMDFFERHGALFVADKHCLASKPLEPFDHVLGIGHAAAEEQQLRLRRRESHCQLVVQAPIQVFHHLIFVHDE